MAFKSSLSFAPADITHEIHSVSPRPVKFGGFSDIYTGIWQSALGEVQVALKVVRISDHTSETLSRRLKREISLWKRLSHPNIHNMCGLFQGFGQLPAIVSPWYDNGDINTYLKAREGDPDLDVVKLSLLVQVLTGLKYLHDNNVVHADIKGGNVLVSDSGDARLGDFGLSALLTEHSLSFTNTELSGKGSCRWMAPELHRDEDPKHSTLSDIWACGCLFIEVQCAVVPYHTKRTTQQLIIAISVNHELPPRPPGMPDLLWSLVCDCCKMARDQRLPVDIVLERLQIQGMVSDVLHGVHGELQAQGIIALLASMKRSAASAAVLDISTLEALHTLSHLHSHYRNSLLHPELFTRSIIDMLNVCIDLAADGYSDLSDGPLVPTAAGLISALQCLEGLSVHHFSPSQLRPLARFLAREDRAIAQAFMRLFSTRAMGIPLAGHFGEISSVAWFPQGDRVVSASSDGTLLIHNVQTGQAISCLIGHSEAVTCAAVSPDGLCIASSSCDGSVRVWDADTGHAIGQPMTTHTSVVWAVAWSPTDAHIVSGSNDQTVRIWSVATGETVVGPMVGHTRGVTSVAVSPDGSRVVSGSDDMTIRIWNARTGDCLLAPQPDHTGWVNSVAFAPDGRGVVSGSADHTFRIWRAKTGQSFWEPWMEHVACVRSAVFSPDGMLMASGSDDGTVCVQDAQTGAHLTGSFEGHDLWVLSVAFSPDGRLIASGSGDCTIRIWDATDDWMRWDL